MARLNEITSTEKLLDLIRNKTGAPLQKKGDAGKAAPAVLPSPQEKSKGIPFRKVAVYKPMTVGVDIGHQYLRLIKTVKGADGSPALVDQQRVVIPAGFQHSSVEFTNFLKEHLTPFCGVSKKLQIWAIMSAANVEVRHIRIPKVPKKQLEAVILWTINKETPIKENENVLDFEVLGEVMEQGIAKWAVMYYTAPKQEIEDTKRLFSRAGWPLTGLSITPFAVQNIFRTRWLADSERTVACLFIGNDYTRIDVYAQGSLVMTRGIKAGVSSMTESLIEGYNEKAALKRGGGGLVMETDKARDILFSLSPDSPPLPDEVRCGLQESEIWEMLLPAMERLVRQVERTFEYFSVTLGQERVEKIYVSGEMNVYRPITEYLGAQLGMASDTFDPLSAQLDCHYGEEDKSFSCISERAAFAPVLGIALSDNKYTPNFIFTYKDKKREASVKRINMIIFFVFMFSVSICTGFFLYQQQAIGKKKNTVLQLNQQLAQFRPPVDRDIIMKSAAVVKQEIASAKLYGQRYQGLAIIAELANLVAPEIRLVNIRAKLGISPEKAKEMGQEKAGAAQAKKTEDLKEIEIEGFVEGDKKSFDTTLGNYALMLDNSPLFKDIKIQKAGVENFRKTTLLRFTITMKVEGI